MRSDYYTLIPPETPRPPVPSPAPRRPRGQKKGLALFVCFLLLLAGGTGLLGWYFGPVTPSPDWDRWVPYIFDPYTQIFPEAETPAETTIRTLDPPGAGGVILAEEGEGVLPATDIYQAISPAVLAVEARYAAGGGAEGTGVLFDPRGYFLTNAHVIVGSDRVSVTLSGGQQYQAYLIGMDEETDLAVLKISAKDLPVAPFGSDLELVVGEDVYAIGNPLGSQFQGSITEGIISGIDRSVVVEGNPMTLIQTTAAINTGSSGGALVNTRGQVVGITNMKMISWYATVEGLGFAIPSTTVQRVVEDLMAVGYVRGRPVLGITVRPAQVPEESATEGLYVAQVNPGSDAWAKGLRQGDVLLTANGIQLKGNADLLALRTDLEAGDTMELSWLPGGDGQRKTAQVALVEEFFLE